MSERSEAAEPAWVRHGLEDLGALRRAVYDLALTTKVPAETVDGFVVAVSEVASNALRHGSAPFSATAWAAVHTLLCAVTDSGDGIEGEPAPEPPEADSPPDYGMGLWAVHELCDSVTYTRTDDAFTVQLRVEG